MSDRPPNPLYDRRYEHDACGVGFVADAGGRSRRRVLPLALAGLGSLGHRGAFAADGASSDGAGVLLPLESSVLGSPRARGGWSARGRLVVPPALEGRRRRGAPDRRSGAACRAAASRRLAERAVRSGCARAGGGREPPGLRPGPGRAAERAVGCPVRAPAGPRPAAHGDRRPRGRVGPRRVRRPVGLVPIDRLQGSRRRRPAGRPVPRPRGGAPGQPRDLPPALRHEHPSRVASGPAVPGDRPQRRDQHRPDEPRAGPRPGGRPARGRRLACPPADRGRAATLVGRLGFDVARRGARAAGGQRLEPRDGPPGARPRSGGTAAVRPPTGRGVRPTDCGLPRAVGRPRRAGLRRRPAGRSDGRSERPPSTSLRRHPGSVGGSRLGDGRRPDHGRRDDQARPARAGRDAPRRPAPRGDPRRRRGEDRDPAQSVATGRSASGVRRSPGGGRLQPGHVDGAPPAGRARRRARPTRHQDDGPRGQGAALEHGRRHADPGPGADRPTGLRPPPAGLRPGHQPADRPGTGASGHGPPGRARSSLGAARRHPGRTANRAAGSTDRRRPEQD